MSNRDEAMQIISFLEQYIDANFPGSRKEVTPLKGAGAIRGFGIAHAGALTIVYANAAGDGQWWVQVQSAIGNTIYYAQQTAGIPLRTSFFGWCGSSIRMNLETAAEHAGMLGGQQLPPNESGFMQLLLIADASD
jgi:hypothetical protein